MKTESKTPTSHTEANIRVRVWDLPTRLFHWTLALAFLVAAVSSEDQTLKLHVLTGEVIAGLLVFRVFWGFVGGHYSRFSQFSFSYLEVKEHLLDLLIGRHKHYLSHNPAGSWSVLIMLIGCAVVVFGGLLLLGGEEQHGIAQNISPLFGAIANWLHSIAGNLLIAFIFVHIAGVVVDSRLTGVNLVKSMLHGHKDAPKGSVSVKLGVPGSLVMVLTTVVIAAALMHFNGEGGITKSLATLNPFTSFTSKPLQQSPLWQETCADCHMSFHPSLLPARSWKKIFAEQNDHFGEDLFLDKPDLNTLLKFALANSAEHGMSEPARKINASTDPETTPIRITDTPYWQHKHDEIGASIWKRKSVSSKSNCAACHRDARQGLFEDNAMHVPN